MNEGSKLLCFLLLYTEFCLGFLCAHGLAGKPCDAKLLVLLAESVPVTIISQRPAQGREGIACGWPVWGYVKGFS